jgi:hypothetical protein
MRSRQTPQRSKGKRGRERRRSFVWAWKLVSFTRGRTQIESVREQGAEENI